MKALVGGIGNIFFGDDGFGCEVARCLAAESLSQDVRVVDFGIRGMHAAFEMLDGYDVVILVDVVSRAGAPGTLFVIEPDDVDDAVPDAHAMALHGLLAMFERLAASMPPDVRPAVTIVGCEPETIEERIGLSLTVEASVEPAAALVHRLLAHHGMGVQLYETR